MGKVYQFKQKPKENTSSINQVNNTQINNGLIKFNSNPELFCALIFIRRYQGIGRDGLKSVIYSEPLLEMLDYFIELDENGYNYTAILDDMKKLDIKHWKREDIVDKDLMKKSFEVDIDLSTTSRRYVNLFMQDRYDNEIEFLSSLYNLYVQDFINFWNDDINLKKQTISGYRFDPKNYASSDFKFCTGGLESSLSAKEVILNPDNYPYLDGFSGRYVIVADKNDEPFEKEVYRLTKTGILTI